MNETPANSTFTTTIRLPCSEACAAYRSIAADGWSEYGLCTNRQSPLCGYPARLGRDCSYYQVSAEPETHGAASGRSGL
jgi:hypothetical protein